jgi:transposase
LRTRLAVAEMWGEDRPVPVKVAAATAESVRSIEEPEAMLARKRRGLTEVELGDGRVRQR